jgi:hypothetical protein
MGDPLTAWLQRLIDRELNGPQPAPVAQARPRSPFPQAIPARV